MASQVEKLIRKTVTAGVSKVAEFNRSRMDAGASNPFLEGLHTPLEEEYSLETLDVIGTIPEHLDGRYLRIGPNPAAPPNAASYHWFSGDGMVHGLRLKGGKALWYRNRWIRSAAVEQARGLPAAPGERNGPRDTVNTNVIGHAGSIWALVEAGTFPVRLDEGLESVAYDPFGGTLKGSFSAHPHLDPDTGQIHAICYEATRPHEIRHVVVNPAGAVVREEPIPVRDGPSIHDCMITKNYVIILDLPVTFSMARLIKGFAFPYAWNPEHPARVGLLPRTGTAKDVIWCAVEPCYVFHPCNGFEDDQGRVVLDVCVHSTMFAESTMGPDSKSVPFERWTITPSTASVARAVIDPDSQEFPRPNEARIGKPYRFAYTMAVANGGDPAFVTETRLFKHDLQAGTRQVHDFGSGRVPGEFVFVSRPDAKAEDDGWLMGLVIDGNAAHTELVILDAQSFEGEPQARIVVPHRIPPGFHGNWVPAV